MQPVQVVAERTGRTGERLLREASFVRPPARPEVTHLRNLVQLRRRVDEDVQTERYPRKRGVGARPATMARDRFAGSWEQDESDIEHDLEPEQL
jgi:hypothetical protein